MNIKLYDTYQKKDIEIQLDHKIKMYSCGPTVYNYLHIGNVVAVFMPELIKNSIIYSGGEVEWSSNVTDLGHLSDDGDHGEDKMEKGAKREGKTAKEIAQFYYTDFLKQLNALNIEFPKGRLNPHASDYI
ncbi:MAG: cysteine--tRNA ligase, partial [Patescibacteria group bacterium]